MVEPYPLQNLLKTLHSETGLDNTEKPQTITACMEDQESHHLGILSVALTRSSKINFWVISPVPGLGKPNKNVKRKENHRERVMESYWSQEARELGS